LFIAIITPLPLASGAVAIRIALSRLRGPSKSAEDALRCAPIRITGLSDFTVKSSQYAVSSIVSVPWAITTPATSGRAKASSTDLVRRVHHLGST